ncbi:MAG: PQQ-binding-like beta-propeller repeat protein [Alphaproteobacteria bacterium]
MRRATVHALAAALTLGACDILPDWLGDPEKPHLPGERISILELDAAPTANPDIADLAVRLPRPRLNGDWPQSGGFAHHAMHHIEATGPLAWAWTAGVGQGVSEERRMPAPPISAGGRVFALDTVGTVTAVRADTGERLWRVNLIPEDEEDDAFGGGIAYGDGVLFVTTGVGEVVALDPVTSGEYWRVRVGTPIRAAPTYSNGRVFVVSYDNQLHALDGSDGSALWTHRGVAEIAQLLQAASPAVTSGLVVSVFSSGEIYALRVENGRQIWSDSLSFGGRFGPLASLGDINGHPVIDDNLVYAVSHAGRMVAIALQSGERLWEQDIASVQTPWIAGDFIYVLSSESALLCLSRIDGRIRWVRSLPRYVDPEEREELIFWSGPLLVSDRLIVVGSSGDALSISPYTGRFLGRVALPGDVELPPIAANGMVYVLTNDGELAALR